VNFDTFFGDAADPCGARPSGAGSRAACDVRASGGVFYDPFQTDQYRRAILVNGSPAFFRLPVTPRQAFAPSFPNVLTGIPPGATSTNFGIATVNPDFASPYSSNANISITREITTHMSLTATYLYTLGNRLPIFRNINLVPGGATLADGRSIFGQARVFPGFGSILSAESSASRNPATRCVRRVPPSPMLDIHACSRSWRL
jgi:hypothetical protein